MRTAMPSRSFAIASRAGRYWHGASRGGYLLAKRSSWSDSTRLPHLRYALNNYQTLNQYTTNVRGKGESSNASAKPAGSENVRLSPTKGLEQPIAMPFHRLNEGTWLHNRPEADVYKLLVDAYRLRVEDTYVFKGELMEDSIHAGRKSGIHGFRKFLKCAATVPGLLPPWWNKEKRKACEKLGMDESQWANLRFATQKSDIMEHYGDRLFPMQLRMLAEAVYGIHP
ncbi:hypothetical protein V8C42DRAFT_321153 [Trichoderma barbatum]